MLTLEQKQDLQTAAESGTRIWSISFDPSLIEGDPINDFLGLGGVFSFFRIDTAQLSQAVITSTDLS